MYVNKAMSLTKIADELNKREILAPAIYLKIPIYIKRESSNGKYLWLRTQIGKILKNEVYIGSVVGRKYQKVSHKIAKVRMTKEEEHIVVENMHEPIIDLSLWSKAQEKLKEKNVTRVRRYDHPLKGLVFCRECGSIATLRCRTEKRKSGKVWRADYFICSKRNSYTSLCSCKQIQANLIEEKIRENLQVELKNISYSEKELKEIFKKSQINLKNKEENLKQKLKKQEEKLNWINKVLEEIYQDKIEKIITIEDFEMLYKKQNTEKNKLIKQMQEEKLELKQISEQLENVDIERINQKAKEVLQLDNITKEMYQRLIERVEFDKDKNIYITFRFSKYIDEEAKNLN